MFFSRLVYRCYVWHRYFIRFKNFCRDKPIESCIVLVLFISTLLPLRCPTGRGYDYLELSEISQDLITCLQRSDGLASLAPCPLMPDGLSKFQVVNTTPNMSRLDRMAEELKIKPGGVWRPQYCKANQRVAIVVPYRDRELQLQIFIQYIHPFLQAQQLEYGIFVIEQNMDEFNRGKLFNIGFKEALKMSDYCCFIFHDVDLLPQSPRHIYSCSTQPRHMCSALDTFRYVLPYPGLFGGVVAFSRSQFEAVNGYSNIFFGWGGEDDDLYNRLEAKGFTVRRWEPTVSRYTMLFHAKAVPNPNRHMLLLTGHERYTSDGLNSLKYEVLSIQLKPLYTRILVNVRP